MSAKTKQKKTETTEKEKITVEENRNLVVCKNIVKHYDDRNIAVEALRGIDLCIKENEFVAIVGASGSGKTTLLNIIGGLDSPTSGEIEYLGQDISQLSDDDRILLRRRIGYIFQDFNLHPVLTALQNVELPMIYAEELIKQERLTRSQLLLTQRFRYY